MHVDGSSVALCVPIKTAVIVAVAVNYCHPFSFRKHATPTATIVAPSMQLNLQLAMTTAPSDYVLHTHRGCMHAVIGYTLPPSRLLLHWNRGQQRGATCRPINGLV